MRVVFNSFDTHVDINNIIDVEGFSIRKINYTDDPIIITTMLDPSVVIGSVGDTGTLTIEDDENNISIFNGNVKLDRISINNVQEAGLSFVRYTYEFVSV
jgi:hypothetical protein